MTRSIKRFCILPGGQTHLHELPGGIRQSHRRGTLLRQGSPERSHTEIREEVVAAGQQQGHLGEDPAHAGEAPPR